MGFAYFASGFMSGFALMTLILFGLFLYRRQIRRRKSTVIRGYLDLIPDLSPAQRESVREIRVIFLPRVAKIRERLRLKRAELASLLFEEQPDRSKIDTVARQILLHQSDLENEVIDHILQEKELLTPPQRRKFYEIIVEQFSSGGLGVHDVKGRH